MNEVLRVEQVTPRWLSALLDRDVTAVEASPIGTGQVGATYRFAIDRRETLVGKFAAVDAFTRETAVAQGSYRRETGFYRDLARPGLPVPEVLHVAFDEASHDFALVMRDLGGFLAGDQLVPLRREQAEAAVEALARVHAAFWEDRGLDAFGWLPGSAEAPAPQLDALYDMLWPAFLDRYGERVSGTVREVGDAYRGQIDRWTQPRGPRTLVHGDFRHDNLLFGPGNAVVIVDWQTCALGCGASDLAYFAGTSLAPEDRRHWEHELFERWHGGLCAYATDREELWLIYRRDSFGGFLMGVAASMIVGRTDRGDAMFLAMCERAAAMVQDFGSANLI